MSQRRPWWIVLLAWTASAPGQATPRDEARDPTNRPTQAGRVVHVFDFEESETNPLPVPRNWVRAQDDPGVGRDRPGFPTFNRAELDYGVAFRGVGSVRLPTNGGSTALRLDAGAINVFPGADYLVAARVRTSGLRRAGAALGVEILGSEGGDGRVIASGASAVFRSEGDGWGTIMATVRGREGDGTFLRIELRLLQEREFGGRGTGAHQVWTDDLGGAAWFDDVTVIQLPWVSFTTSSPANIVVAPALPELLVEVKDLAGESLRGVITLQDVDARVVAEESHDVATGTSVRRWRPRVPGYGWYRATLELWAGGLRVGSRYVDFIYLPEAQAGSERSPDRARFGLSSSEMPPGLMALAPAIAGATGAGSFAIPIWAPDLTPESMQETLDRVQGVVAGLEARRASAAFVLSRVPDVLRVGAYVDADDPASLLALERTRWESFLIPFLDRFGQSVRRWQIGSDVSAKAGSSTPERLREAASLIAQLVPGPEIRVPLSAAWAPDPDLLAPESPVGGVSLLLPSSVGEGSIGLALGATEGPSASPGVPASLVFEPLDPERFGRRGVVADLARKAIEAWAIIGDHGPQAVVLHEAWGWEMDGSDDPAARGSAQVMPAPELALWRTLHDALRDRRSAGLVDLAPGVRCHVLVPIAGSDRSGALALWRVGGGSSTARKFLGAGEVEAVDLFGNRRALARRGGSEGGGQGEHEIPVGDSPIFIEGVDVNMIRFVSSLRLEPAFVESAADVHPMSVRLTNPWPVRIEGRLAILEPGGLGGDLAERDRTWRLSPRMIPFSIGPGEEASLAFSMSFGPGEEAGAHPFVVEMDLVADRDYRGLSVSSSFEIGIRDIELELTYRVGEGDALIVEARATNRSANPMTLRLLAFAPGHARQDASVLDLEPGSTASRRFAFAPGSSPGAPGAAGLKGERVVVAAVDADAGRRLNRSVEVE